MIKIKKYEKCRNATRIEFLAGKRAVDDSLKNDRYLTEICRYLSSTEKEAISGIKSLHNKLEEIMHTNKKLEEKISKYQIKEMIEEADKIGEISLIKKIYENENVKYISKMASKLVELDNVVALIALKNDEKSNFVFASSKNISNLNMSELIKDAITLVDGRGGGSQFLAQGGGKDNGNIESLLNYAQMKIERTLNK